MIYDKKTLREYLEEDKKALGINKNKPPLFWGGRFGNTR